MAGTMVTARFMTQQGHTAANSEGAQAENHSTGESTVVNQPTENDSPEVANPETLQDSAQIHNTFTRLYKTLQKQIYNTLHNSTKLYKFLCNFKCL